MHLHASNSFVDQLAVNVHRPEGNACLREAHAPTLADVERARRLLVERRLTMSGNIDGSQDMPLGIKGRPALHSDRSGEFRQRHHMGPWPDDHSDSDWPNTFMASTLGR